MTKKWGWQDLKKSTRNRARKMSNDLENRPNFTMAQLSGVEAYKARAFNAAAFYGGIAVLVAFIGGFLLGVVVR